MTTSDVTIYHNPSCSKSRATLALLRARGIEPRIIEYLEHPPDSSTLERIIQMLDPTMVPLNERLCPEEVEACLRVHGARDVERFLRGADSDRVEKVYQKLPHADVKYGVGENRFIFTRP